MTNPIFEKFTKEIAENDVVLYMKGNQHMPMCGFSARAVAVFQQLGVKIHDVNVLEDEEVRAGIKEFSDWPTIPQTYIKGEFVGGSDILIEMFENGELKKLLEEKKVI